MTDQQSFTLPVHPTIVEVRYPSRRGRIGLRGSHAPLSWEHTQPPDEEDGDRHLFRIAIPAGELVELKLVRNEEEWAAGRNFTVHAGDDLHRFVYTGATHDAPSWQARIAVPLQILFPPEVRAPPAS